MGSGAVFVLGAQWGAATAWASLAGRGAAAGPEAGEGSGLGAGPGVQSVVLSEQLFLPSKLTLVWLQQL